MTCWVCEGNVRRGVNFCGYCGVPQGKISELKTSLPGYGNATVKSPDGTIYNVTFEGYQRTELRVI